MNSVNPEDFVSQRLEPQRSANNLSYRLTRESVSLTRRVRGEDGVVREETVPAIYSRKFVDQAGNVCDVLLRTGRVKTFEPEAVRYEQVCVIDQVTNGCIPLESCPYSSEAKHIIGGPYIKPPKGVESCAGAADGCVHMKEVIAERRAITREEWEKQQPARKTLTMDEAATLVRSVRDAFGQQNDEDDAPAPRKVKGAGKPSE